VDVYIISGFNNKCYDGIFSMAFNSEEKMLNEVQDLMALDMDMSRAAFIRLQRENRKEFDDRFGDEDRSYEECLEDGAYYCSNGYELSWGNYDVQ